MWRLQRRPASRRGRSSSSALPESPGKVPDTTAQTRDILKSLLQASARWAQHDPRPAMWSIDLLPCTRRVFWNSATSRAFLLAQAPNGDTPGVIDGASHARRQRRAWVAARERFEAPARRRGRARRRGLFAGKHALRLPTVDRGDARRPVGAVGRDRTKRVAAHEAVARWVKDGVRLPCMRGPIAEPIEPEAARVDLRACHLVERAARALDGRNAATVARRRIVRGGSLAYRGIGRACCASCRATASARPAESEQGEEKGRGHARGGLPHFLFRPFRAASTLAMILSFFAPQSLQSARALAAGTGT